MEIEDKTITVIDGKGNEHLMTVLFTYDNEQRKCSYVFFSEGEDNDEVICMRYHDDGSLEEIEDDEEYEECSEVFDAWQNDPKIQDLKNDSETGEEEPAPEEDK